MKTSPKFFKSLPLSEIAKLVFEDSIVLPPLSTKEIKGWSCEIDDADLSWWEIFSILNVSSLMNKMSIKNSTLSLIRHRSLFIFFDYSFSKLTKLHLEEINFTIMNKNDPIRSNEFSSNAVILKTYNININSYCIFYILKKSKILNSLEEISITQKDSSFAEDLYKLIAKELAWSKVEMKTKITYRDSDTLEVVEITKDYLNNKMERRIENVRSNIFERVSYEFISFRKPSCFKIIFTIRVILYTS